MIDITQLRVDTKYNRIYIDAKISDMSYYSDMKITDVFIDTHDHYTDALNRPSSDVVYSKNLDTPSKTVHLVIDKLDSLQLSNVDFKSTMFFVYFKVTGIPAPDCPCNADREYHLFTVFDKSAIYCRMMQYTKEIADSCDIPKGFIDLMLLLDYIDISLETGNYVPAIKYYERFLGKVNNSTIPIKSCNCHG